MYSSFLKQATDLLYGPENRVIIDQRHQYVITSWNKLICMTIRANVISETNLITDLQHEFHYLACFPTTLKHDVRKFNICIKPIGTTRPFKSLFCLISDFQWPTGTSERGAPPSDDGLAFYNWSALLKKVFATPKLQKTWDVKTQSYILAPQIITRTHNEGRRVCATHLLMACLVWAYRAAIATLLKIE